MNANMENTKHYNILHIINGLVKVFNKKQTKKTNTVWAMHNLQLQQLWFLENTYLVPNSINNDLGGSNGWNNDQYGPKHKSLSTTR